MRIHTPTASALPASDYGDGSESRMMPSDDHDIRVRPVPLDADPEALSFDLEEAAPDRRSLGKGRLVAASAAVAATLLVAGGLGSLSDRTDEPAPEVEFSTVAHLRDDATLVLAAAATSNQWAITWTPLPGSQSTGAIGAIPAPTAPTAESPDFDVAGEWRASTECAGSVCELAISRADDRATVVASVAALDHVWHAIEPGRLAWLESPDGSAVLRTGTMDSVKGLVGDSDPVPVERGTRIALWDEQGFVVEAGEVRTIDATGTPLWIAEGSILDATSPVVTLEDDLGGWSVLDRASGSVIMRASPSEAEVVVARNRAGRILSSVAIGGYRYTFTIGDETGVSSEPQHADFQRLPIGFDDGSVYRLLRSVDGEQFTFHLVRPS